MVDHNDDEVSREKQTLSSWIIPDGIRKAQTLEEMSFEAGKFLQNSFIKENKNKMDKISYNKDVILSTLRKNKEKHIVAFKEAWVEFQRLYKEKLEKMLEKAPSFKEGDHVPLNINLLVPVNKTEDYDQAIMMFELSNQTSFELEENEIRQYLMDNWHWQREWTSNTLSYTGRHR